jgi:hypothetical protein
MQSMRSRPRQTPGSIDAPSSAGLTAEECALSERFDHEVVIAECDRCHQQYTSDRVYRLEYLRPRRYRCACGGAATVYPGDRFREILRRWIDSARGN